MLMKLCPNCGDQLLSSIAFCGNCGFRFPAQPAPPTPDDCRNTCPACGQPDGFQLVRLRKLDAEPTNAHEYVDYLVRLQIAEGVGCLENAVDPNDPGTLHWRFRSRRTGEEKILASVPAHMFRVILARFGWRLINNPYVGHGLFQVRFEDEDEPRPERFSVYLCNEPGMGIWLKLYLYAIDGVRSLALE